MSPTWKKNVYNFDQNNIVAHELDQAYGGQTVFESLVDKTIVRQIGVPLHFSALDRFKVKCELDHTFLTQ